jgi:hypothetical protein
MLYYRGKSVELVYVDDTGEEVARALDDYDVTLGYSAFDLTNIDELIDGDVYFLRVKLVHDAFENVDESTAWLDWATEEDW